MNEPQPGQRFDLEASLEDMVENPKGEFALAADLDAALDLLARVRSYELIDSFDGVRMLGLERLVDDLLAKHGRHP